MRTIAGHHHDAFELKPYLQSAFKSIKRLGLTTQGAFSNADTAFARKTCFNHGLIPNIDKFRALLSRFEIKDVFFLGGHFIAYAMINPRHILAQTADIIEQLINTICAQLFSCITRSSERTKPVSSNGFAKYASKPACNACCFTEEA